MWLEKRRQEYAHRPMGSAGGYSQLRFLRADCMPGVRHRKHSHLPLDTWEARPSCPAGQRGYQPQSG